jgi:UDP-N-acetylmuramate-alanine ligase
MSALAQVHAWRGGRCTGSDRAFDAGERDAIRSALSATGVEIVPQDGTWPQAGCDAMVISTAVEESVPDVQAARAAGVPLLHRSELLAEFLAGSEGIAVTGTSGKSTTTAMVTEILLNAELDPTVITGGALVSLEEDGLLGNACAGTGPHLVIEADESDGSVVRYHPWASVILNLQRDHKEPAEVLDMFKTLVAQTRGPVILGDDPVLDPLSAGAIRAGLTPECDVRAVDIELAPNGSRFRIDDVIFMLPAPGEHNIRDAVAATAVALEAGVSLEFCAEALGDFCGVARRHQVVGTARGVTVIDDFAHNPDKLRASLAAAHLSGGRVLAFFQPHGYGPTRFLFDDLVAAFADALTVDDVLWLPPIYYAGGTVTRDVESTDLTAGVRQAGRDARDLADRDELSLAVAAEARPGDVCMIMGARDPGLSDLARSVVTALEQG